MDLTLDFAATARTWRDFYMLAGTAAATLTGLMFLAVTFGFRLVTRKSFAAAEAWSTPNAMHFVGALGISCVMQIPNLTPAVLGWGLLALGLLRLSSLPWVLAVFRRVRRQANDIEWTDWVYLVILPLAAYLGLLAAAFGFLHGAGWAFDALAGYVVFILVLGILAAWDVLLWMALKIT